jgi:hypothetical protein
MKKIVFIIVIATLLFAGCKTKEEKLIVGEWKLTDIKITLDPTIEVKSVLWEDYVHDNNKSLTLIFIKVETFKLIKKDGLDTSIETGTYFLRNDLSILNLKDWYEDWFTGWFEDVILEKQELIFKCYIITSNTGNISPPPDYFTYIFKKIK